MEVFRNLTLRGSKERFASLFQTINSSLKNGWSRDLVAEGRMRSGLLDRTYYCYACTDLHSRRSATLFLIADGDAELRVANIVPSAPGSLSYSEYNLILEEFFRLFVEPAVPALGIEAELTSDHASLSTWLSQETGEKLHYFSSLANKSTGSSHSSDRERWFDFILAAHRESATLSPSTLERWLQEEDGWGTDEASDLAIEYEFARSLLRFAENR